jgi:HPt (histidine-containing phosphotransfer) domain-containing protein
VSKLDAIIERWVAKEKRELGIRNEELGKENGPGNTTNSSFLISHSSLITIPGVDVQKGIAMTGGTLELYRKVLALFRKDAEDRLPVLQTMPEESALPEFITQVHALKSASASLGAAEVSEEAARLEAAGKAGDFAFIQKNLGGFAQHLSELIKGIDAALASTDVTGFPPAAAAGDNTALLPLLRELQAALESESGSEIDRVLEELSKKPLDAKTKEILEQISDQVLMAEFENAIKILGGLLKGSS